MMRLGMHAPQGTIVLEHDAKVAKPSHDLLCQHDLRQDGGTSR